MDLAKYMLREERQHVIDIKALIMKQLISLVNKLGMEPTYENTSNPNTHVWIDVADKFMAMEDNPGREPLFRAILKWFIVEHEHDPYYRDREMVILELWLDAVLEGRVKPRSRDHPYDHWKVDPNIRGKGYEFIAEKYHQARRQRERSNTIL